MFDLATPTSTAPAALLHLREFALEHEAALMSAAALLGGSAWQGRTRRLLCRLSDATAPTRTLRGELDALHGLLTLRRVHEWDSIEAACFAEIAPDDPRVEEICLLSDQLGTLLAAL